MELTRVPCCDLSLQVHLMSTRGLLPPQSLQEASNPCGGSLRESPGTASGSCPEQQYLRKLWGVPLNNCCRVPKYGDYASLHCSHGLLLVYNSLAEVLEVVNHGAPHMLFLECPVSRQGEADTKEFEGLVGGELSEGRAQ
jgi:hypothetical protein